jgi:OmpA-OmpF porin, OOP family
MQQYPFFLFLFLLKNTLFAQNLVKNPSFETLTAPVLPCTYTNVGSDFNKSVVSWKSSENVTPDILTVEKGCFTFSPRTGQNMVGIIAYHPHEDSGYDFDYREQIQGELTRPLEVGKTYTFEFWVYADDSLAARHLKKVLHTQSTAIVPLFCNNLGVAFKEQPLDVKTPWHNAFLKEKELYYAPNVVQHSNGGWRKIQFLVQADKPYRYFYLGNFHTDKETKTSLPLSRTQFLDSINSVPPLLLKRAKTFWERKKRIAYYCLDDVSLQEGNHLEKQAEIPVFAPKSTYTFKNVVFETNKAILVPSSLGEIDALAVYLIKHPSQRIVITGHTDNIGTELQNQQLSEQRATSVQQALLRKGCNIKQIATQGKGSLQPINNNTSAEGRQQNRRVEVRFRE